MLTFIVVQNIVVSAGIVFGFPSLAVLLLSEGQYAGLCIGAEASPCAAQQTRLERVFVVGQASLGAGMFLNGRLLDWLGPRKVTLSCLCVMGIGLLLLALADSGRFDAFDVACALLGFGGSGLHLGAFHVSALFEQRRRGTVTSVLVGTFIFSGIMWLGWAMLCINWGANRMVVGLVHAGVVLFVVLPASSQLQPPRRFRDGDTVTIQRLSLKLQSPGEGVAAGTPTTATTRPPGPKYLSIKFAGILLFFGTHYVNFAFLLGVWGGKLQAMGDRDGLYPRILSLAMPLFALTVPLIGQLIDKCGLPIAFVVTSLCGVGYNVLIVMNRVPGALVVLAIAVFSFFRVLVFSAMFSYVAKHFGLANFGRVCGVVLSVSTTAAFGFGFFAPEVIGGRPHWDGVLVGWLIVAIASLSFGVYVRVLERGSTSPGARPPPPPVVTSSSATDAEGAVSSASETAAEAL